MRLIKSGERFYVECHTSDCGYEHDDTYVFPNKKEVEKFLGVYSDYINHEYFSGEDVYRVEHHLGVNEYVKHVYSKTEYEVKYEV